MKNNHLKKLGYNKWIEDISSEHLNDDFSLARVIEVNKNSYIVSDGKHEMYAELTGKFLFNADDNTILPTVGDWVSIQALNDFTIAVVHSVLPRKSLLKRKESGKKIDFQLIAANIDFGLIIQSANDINFNLLDRYFVMLNENKINPIAIVNKIDLLTSVELENLKNKLLKLKNKYLLVSNTLDNGIEELTNILKPQKTYCLLGKSGVGKTSLLNNLLESNVFKTNEVREKDGKGKHTTVKRQLICLESGSIFIDTPGIREFGIFDIESGLNETFDEFLSYATRCRFRDCSHINEKGCAIIEALKNDEIDKYRYENYLKLKKESAFYKMSYQEKRKKNKSLGKVIKNYKKIQKKTNYN